MNLHFKQGSVYMNTLLVQLNIMVSILGTMNRATSPNTRLYDY